MYKLEGLKLCCVGSLEINLSVENAHLTLEQAEKLICPCDELVTRCQDYLRSARKPNGNLIHEGQKGGGLVLPSGPLVVARPEDQKG